MEKDIKINLEAPWEVVKERMKESNIDLTDADLEYVPGKEDELLSRLEKVMNKRRPDIIAYIESISSNKAHGKNQDSPRLLIQQELWPI